MQGTQGIEKKETVRAQSERRAKTSGAGGRRNKRKAPAAEPEGSELFKALKVSQLGAVMPSS